MLAPSAHRIATVVAVVLLGASCSSGAFTGSSGDRSTTASSSSASSSETTPTRAEKPRYSYHLPYGDTPNAQDDAVVYMHLLAGRCEVAQGYLDQTWHKPYEYYGGPRAVVLFQAAVEMCRGRVQRGGTFIDLAEQRYGLEGLAKDEYSCNIYRAGVSVLRQVPLTSVTCPGGTIPWWPGDRTCDDPRTPADECVATEPDDTATAPDGEATTPTTSTTSTTSTSTTSTSTTSTSTSSTTSTMSESST